MYYYLLDVEKQKKKKVDAKNQGNYIDTSRNISVNLDSRELRNCIKKLKVEDGEVDNSGLVNSDMYLREAGHFSNKGLHLTAASNLTIGS